MLGILGNNPHRVKTRVVLQTLRQHGGTVLGNSFLTEQGPLHTLAIPLKTMARRQPHHGQQEEQKKKYLVQFFHFGLQRYENCRNFANKIRKSCRTCVRTL